MSERSAPRRPWLPLSAALSVAILAVVVALGWDRSFWFDEVYTLGAAAVGRAQDWDIILRDVHPPTFTMLVRTWGEVVGGSTPALRAINLIGAAALALGLWIASKQLERGRFWLLVCLVLVNGYTLQLGLDLRSYALLLGLTFLAQALLLAEFSGKGAQTGWLILLAAILGSLHFFGTAAGLTILGVSALGHLRAGRIARAAVLGMACLVIGGAVLGFAFGIASASGQLGGINWIKTGPEPLLDFFAQQILLVLLVFGLALFRRSPSVDPAQRRIALWMLAVPGIVAGVTLLISLHTPVLTTRNLIVCVPGVSLAAVLLTPPALMQRLSATPLLLIAVALVGIRVGDIATRNTQMIEWAITTAAPAACDGAPIYVIRPSTVDKFAQEVFLGGIKRPQIELTSFSPDNAPLPPGCDMLAVGWHQIGEVSDVIAFFDSRGVRTEAILPPDTRLAKRAAMTSGFVIRVVP
ncbi:hypothetical protein [Oceanibium sediminis]|uniref:hypothetical protein n=1 Tax=Oceanibium sediminis TaxID=2026339 RepID=UPI0013008272|nr:hypothetical protein [Oceanibium sediminis]